MLSRGFMRILSLLVLMLSCLSAGAGQGAVPPAAEVCEWATQQAAQENGVPPDILGALTLTETGRRMDGVVRPWAWSANAEGEGTWFDDPQSAITPGQAVVLYASDRVLGGGWIDSAAD